ncbi:MAG TPA: hypothetical protein VJ794_09265 [Gemmatimonadales bacterium]|nr:hypothetical protein [Gemmatimonadales bacterium]
MRQRTVLFVSLVAGTVLFSACSDTTQPTPASDDKVGFGPVQQPDDPVALVRSVPGFGGFFFDREGVPTVYLRDVGARAQVERTLGPWLTAQGIRPASLRVRRADYDWASLERWQGRATSQALAMRGAVWVDADEARNRVTIGVERGTPAAEVRSAVARLGVPPGAVIVEEVEPVRLAATLRDRIRPVRGAVQINFPGFLCTLGFNATRSGQRSFITNSHCTNVQGGTEATPYWQPTQGVSPAQIATEVADPGYTTGGSCPSGRRCRRSDSSRARYASGTTSTLGRIARTGGVNTGSVTITGNFNITAEGSASVGQSVHKIGRTTGWTRGPVTGTCVDVNVSGTTITQLCQTLVSAGVGAGDSGSPVFRRQGGTSNVTLVGILWGGSGSNLYVYSPISNIETELGALTTF